MKSMLFVLLALCAAGSAAAQWAGPPVPSSLELAAIPGLSSEQQLGLRKIFLQRRDAVEALAKQHHAEFEALHLKARGEHERIDENTDASVRKLLGDEGYRKFAEWHLAHHAGAHGPMGGGMPHGPHGPGGPNGPHPDRGAQGPGALPGAGPAAGPGAPTGEDNDE